jgi:cyclopropane fatty-acyl-phospholipid synthase-like methyltransferase
MALKHCGPLVSRASALDFGCGVGRLVIPLAQVFEHVTGVDISSSMLEVAKQNCSERGINNVDFVRSDDELSRVTSKFDFIHSYIVLQHIPIRRGETIIKNLLERLNDEGILAIHFPFRHEDSVTRKVVYFLRRNFSPFSLLANIARGRNWNEPFVQMNNYDVNRVLVLLSQHGIKDMFLEVVDAGGFVSAFVFARKPLHPMGKFEGEHLWAAELGA